MANALKESYMRGSKNARKMGKKVLDEVRIREADNGGFIVKCSYKQRHEGNGSEMPSYSGYEETEKIAKTLDDVQDLLEDMFGG